jgi:hypothetical protein
LPTAFFVGLFAFVSVFDSTVRVLVLALGFTGRLALAGTVFAWPAFLAFFTGMFL